MSDPHRQSRLNKIVLKAKLTNTGEIMDLTRLADEDLRSIPPQEIKGLMEEELKMVSEKQNTTIYKMGSSFSYSDKNAMKDFNYGNILVEANLPYCLHLPNYFEVKVLSKEQDIDGLVTFRKIWTVRAETEEGKSNTIDFYTEDKPLYFNKSTTLGPRMPYEAEKGWEPYITGRNIEKINDKNGTFRYTKLYIQLKQVTPDDLDNLTDKNFDSLLADIQSKALQIANLIIDNYREITNEINVRKIGELAVNLIYFIPQNSGIYLSNFNTTTAMMNRSSKEIKELQSRLLLGKKPELYKLLMLNAKNSFESNDFTLAIVESFQALDIFLENYLMEEFKKRGDKQENIDKFLQTNWTTKSRLNEGLNEIKKIKANTQKFWDKWHTHYDKTRNEVIHAGKEPTSNEVKETLDVNEEVINWILSL